MRRFRIKIVSLHSVKETDENMNIKNIHLVYYSATFSTRRIVREIASQFEKPIKEYDITSDVPKNDVSLDSDGDLLIVGVPSYAGRVPEMAAQSLKRFLGNNTPAIIVCAYGNRAYDDTLIELKDIVEAHGFKLVSAAAVIAQHSIFPKMAEGRPDADDMEKLHEFAVNSKELLSQISKMSAVSRLMVKGSRPYRDTKPIPLHPEGSKSKCTSCHACAKMCPVGAISMEEPYKTNEKKCISCGRCIVVCPEHARHFGGLLYKTASWKFEKDYAEPKQPEFFYVKS